MTGRKHPLANCEECPYQQNTAYVPSQFPTRPIKLAVVGEAPGPQEARLGIPFMGPSGDILNSVLKHHGFDRNEVLITNICSCRPPGPTEVPPKAAIAACSNRLRQEIEDSGTTKILAVGGTAAKEILADSRTITKLRVGGAKPYKNDKAIEVVATWHPAYCLRTPDAFPSFIKDVSKLTTKNINNWTKPEWRLFDDPETATEAIQRLGANTDRCVIDIEVGTEKDFDYAHPEDYDLLCVGIAYASKKVVVIGENALKDSQVLLALRDYFSRTKIIAHNGKFDLRGLSPVVGVHRLWFDTMLASHALDERPGQHGLEVLSIEKLGAPNWKHEIKQYIPRGGSYGDVPRSILYQYNAYDVCCTWDLYQKFTEEMDERARKVMNFTVSGANEVIYLELAGIHVDLKYNAELNTQYKEKLSKLEWEISQLIGYDINPRSPQQITKFFYNNNLRVKTTNKDYLNELRPKLTGQVAEFIDLLLEHRRESKRYGTYVKSIPNKLHHGKVHTTYLLHGSTSGRLASRNDNLQNIVRDKLIRNQYTVEDEGNVLVQVDYKQAEGRVIANLAHDEYLAGIFRNAELDIFDNLCTQIYGAGNFGKEERVKIKSVFYGLSYGRKAPSIAKELDITLEESAELLSNFKALIPATLRWQTSIAEKVLRGEDLVTPFGRKRSFYLITNENREDVLNEALSFMPQSIASDICLSALITLRPMLASLATIRLTIHDALVFECKKENAEEAIDITKKVMIQAGRNYTDYVPFAVDVSVGQRWGEL